jgi:hypothetical protein
VTNAGDHLETRDHTPDTTGATIQTMNTDVENVVPHSTDGTVSDTTMIRNTPKRILMMTCIQCPN